MKDKVTILMKLRFTSQWMEMIRHSGSMGNWRLKIKGGKMRDGLTHTAVVGYWSDTPQGHEYWRARVAELDNELGI